MANVEISSDNQRKALRNIARVISSLVAGLILLFAVGQWIQAMSDGTLFHDWRLSSTGMVVYCLLIALGSGIGWWRENMGGTILVIAGLGMLSAIIIFNPQDYWVTLIFSLPFLLSGILYIIYWKQSKSFNAKKRISQE